MPKVKKVVVEQAPELIPVEDSKSLKRVKDSGAIINTNRSAYMSAKSRKDAAVNARKRTDSLEAQIAELQKLVKTLAEK